MAVSTITYTNKVALNENTSVADINKIKAEDMNEIKQVVNNNATETSTNTQDIQDLQNGEVYSTSETLTNKVWIDNKPIYRKVFSFGALANVGTKEIDISGSNVSEIIVCDIFIKTSQTTLWLPIAGSNYINYYYDKPNGKITVQTASDRRTFNDNYMILEYTKTTD